MDLEERRMKAKSLFADYLKTKGGRCTSERMAVLDEIVAHKSKFTIDELEEMLEAKHFRVSHGTLYNTIRELMAAHLVRKFQIGKAAHYQFRDGKPQNLYQVCMLCGQVTEFQHVELEDMLNVYRPKRFSVQEFTVTLRGVCAACLARQRKEERKNNKNKIKQ